MGASRFSDQGPGGSVEAWGLLSLGFPLLDPANPLQSVKAPMVELVGFRVISGLPMPTMMISRIE